MKQILISAVVALVVSLAVVGLDERFDAVEDSPEASGADPVEAALSALSYTDALVEDTWVTGRSAGSDRRTLTNAANSVCYLTKVEISGIQGPEDSNACAIEIDDFTGFWQVIATIDEGGRSEVRCNARCLSWESD